MSGLDHLKRRISRAHSLKDLRQIEADMGDDYLKHPEIVTARMVREKELSK